MNYDLSEDHFLFMLFLKEKPRSMGELLEYSPPNKVWNQSMRLSIVDQLNQSGLMDRKFFEDKISPDGIGDLREPIYRLNKKGETLLENYIKQQKEIEERNNLEIRQMQSVVDTNNSVISTNRLQKWLIGLATLFSAISVLISYWAYKKDSVTVVMPPKVVMLPRTEAKERDTSYQNTSQNQLQNPKHQ